MMRGARRSKTTELTRGETAGPPAKRARRAAITSSSDTENRPISIAAAAQATIRATRVGITQTRSLPFLVSSDFMVSSPRRAGSYTRDGAPASLIERGRGPASGGVGVDDSSGLLVREREVVHLLVVVLRDGHEVHVGELVGVQ